MLFLEATPEKTKPRRIRRWFGWRRPGQAEAEVIDLVAYRRQRELVRREEAPHHA